MSTDVPLPPRPDDVPEHATYIYAELGPNAEPRGCWMWHENNDPRDPRSLRMSHVHPDLQDTWEIRLFSVPFLVPKSLPK